MTSKDRPRIIKRPSDEMVYLMTCNKESAKSLVKWLVDNGINASMSGTEAKETMESSGHEEEYIVSQIEIEPAAEYEKVKSAVDAWRQ